MAIELDSTALSYSGIASLSGFVESVRGREPRLGQPLLTGVTFLGLGFSIRGMEALD